MSSHRCRPLYRWSPAGCDAGPTELQGIEGGLCIEAECPVSNDAPGIRSWLAIDGPVLLHCLLAGFHGARQLCSSQCCHGCCSLPGPDRGAVSTWLVSCSFASAGQSLAGAYPWLCCESLVLCAIQWGQGPCRPWALLRLYQTLCHCYIPDVRQPSFTKIITLQLWP